MRTKLLICAAILLGMAWPVAAEAVGPTAAEMAEARRWAAGAFEGKPAAKPFFSFTYDGKPSDGLLGQWELQRTSRRLDERRTERTLTYADPKTGLMLRCVGIEYDDFPTVEWTLHFKNTGDKPTPILADIRPLDIEWDRQPGASSEQTEFRLHHNTGSPYQPNDYQPHETVLGPEVEKRFAGGGGRPTSIDLSYFNLELPTNEGLIVVVGWPGQWSASFTRDKANRVRIRAGQELTHFRLQPGEEVRTPLIVLQRWKGDLTGSQNVWRRWMLAHNLPRPGGKLPSAQFAAGSAPYTNEAVTATTENQKAFIDRYEMGGVKFDYWWMDAGWYPCQGGWWNTGTWEVDVQRFPKGLREISNHLHGKGEKLTLWFEPERVASNTWLANNHPEWILGGKNGGLVNLGNPDAWKWVVDRIDTLITEQGVDLYRQDFNMDPLGAWRANDAPDRPRHHGDQTRHGLSRLLG